MQPISSSSLPLHCSREVRGKPFSALNLQHLYHTPLLPLFSAPPFITSLFPQILNIQDLISLPSIFVASANRNPTELAIDDLSSKQALLAPFTAGAFLIGCYLTLKYTSIDVSLIFQIITTAFGAACLKETLDPIFYSLYTKLNIQPNSRGSQTPPVTPLLASQCVHPSKPNGKQQGKKVQIFRRETVSLIILLLLHTLAHTLPFSFFSHLFPHRNR